MPVDALSLVVHKDKAYDIGRQLTEKLREKIPRQQYDVPIQAAIGSHIIAARDRQGVPQGRDRQVLRRRHLAKAQAPGEPEEGQEAHEERGQGRVPQEAFLAVLELGDSKKS